MPIKPMDKSAGNNLKVELKNHLHIAILDDETVYIKALSKQIDLLDVDKKVTLESFSSPRQLKSRSGDFDLLVLDIDLGVNVENGIKVARQVRADGFKGTICMHSDRNPIVHQASSFKAGIDLYFVKPMSLDALRHLLSSLDQGRKNNLRDEPAEVVNPVKKVLLFEDERIFQRRWKKALGESVVDCFDSLKAFQKNNSESLEAYSFVVCDYYLADNSTGVDVANALINAGVTVPMFLSTNALEVDANDAKNFREIIPKNPIEAKKSIELSLGLCSSPI